VLALAAGGWPGGAAGQSWGGGPIRTIHEFWRMTPEEKGAAQPFEIECDVIYYDAAWRNLWVQDRSGEGAYAFLGASSPAIETGQRVRVRGMFRPPNQQFSFEEAEFEVIGRAEPQVVEVPGRLSRAAMLNRLVELEAFVVQQRRVDPLHVHLTLSVAGRPVFAWMLVEPGGPVPRLADTTVRLRAVAGSPPGGGAHIDSVELKIAGPGDVTPVSSLGEDPRFEVEATPIERLPELSRDERIRVVGVMIAQEPGRRVRIRDETGEVEVMTAQMGPSLIGERVQAIGFPAVEGLQWRLESGLFRGASGVSARPVNPTIRVAAGVMQLLPDEAEKAHPVRLSGVVTWADPAGRFFYLQDTSGGVCVEVEGGNAVPLRLGWNAAVAGETALGTFAPVVRAKRVTNLGDLPLPVARAASLELALSGLEEAQWVEMRGYVRAVIAEAGRARLQVVTSTGVFEAEVLGEEPLRIEAGAVVRLHGVCTAVADARRKLTGIRLRVPAADYVQVEEAAPVDVFDQPARRLENLGQFGTLQLFNRRVKVTGSVLDFRPGRYVQVADGGESLFVMTPGTEPLVPGDRVEAVGILGRMAGSPVLREAVYRKIGEGPPPEPIELGAENLWRPELDGQLVRVAGRLIDRLADVRPLRLSLQSRGTTFEAYLDEVREETAEWDIGGRLEVTGIYEIKYEEEGQPGVFQIRLRNAEDVAVIEKPSPLTPARVLTFAAVLAVAIVACSAWVVALRRRVQRQTAQIREQLEREARLEAELQRAAKLESLGLLAGGIAHDFNNLLTVVMGNLSLATLDMKAGDEAARSLAEAERAVKRARDLTQQLLTFAKGGAPLRAAVMLADIVREVAEFALHGSKVRCTFSFPPDLWPADVDKGQISQVVQNIVINGMQAMPDGGEIAIAMDNEVAGEESRKVLAPGRYVKLAITDHGNGIRAEDLPHIFDPYFTTKAGGTGLGLATVHSIVKKHHGHITVESRKGRTTFHVWLPAASAEPVQKKVERAQVPGGRGRVLFMDDEVTIRELGAAVLRKYGYDVVAVEEGAAAVRAYREAKERGERFDVVVLDLTVPGGMGGREAMAELRRIDPAVRAIVSSGYSNDAVLSDFRAHGFCGMVPKPYEASKLAKAVSEAVAQGAPLVGTNGADA
jgi:Signal transduction histidine kinase